MPSDVRGRSRTDPSAPRGAADEHELLAVADETATRDQSNPPAEGLADPPPTEAIPTAEAIPTTRALPAESTEDTFVPPGFSTIDSILTEDAVDGPDLRLKSVTVSDEAAHEVVFVIEGTGYPGWQVEYLNPAPDAGATPASSTLRVHLRGVDAASTMPTLPASTDMRLATGDPIDGDLSVLLDLDQEPAPFRVHLQHSPLQIVVEITDRS